MVALETALRLRVHGHSVTTACPPGSPLAQELKKQGLPVLEVSRRHKYVAFAAVKALRQELLRENYAGVLVHQLNDLWQVVPAMRGLNEIKLVGVAHTFVGIRKKDFLHRWLYGRLNSLIALTSIHRGNLLEHLPVREHQLDVIPNSVDTSRFQPGKRSEEFRRRYGAGAPALIGVVSRLDMNKGLIESLAAAQELRAQGLEFKLLIAGKETAGEGGTEAVLREEIARRDLSGCAELIGHHANIETVMASFDILLMPSPAETFGRILIEAMACGVPIVASRGGGVPDIIEDGVNGFLVPPLDAGAMAQALRKLLQSAEMRQEMSERGLQIAKQRYDTEAVENRLYQHLGL